MQVDYFAHLAKTEDDENERVGGNRARIAATERVKSQFGRYVGKAEDKSDREARIEFAKEDILDTVTAACEEHGFTTKDNVQEVLSGALRELRKQAFKVASTGTCSGCGKEKEIDGEGRCADCALDAEYENHLERAAGTKVADGTGPKPETGDSYAQERVDVQGEAGPVPTMDTKKVPEGGVPVPETPSNRNPSEMQSISPTDVDKSLADGSHPQPSETGTRIDADKPIGSEQVGGPTSTHPEIGNNASPVTSRWQVEDAATE